MKILHLLSIIYCLIIHGCQNPRQVDHSQNDQIINNCNTLKSKLSLMSFKYGDTLNCNVLTICPIMDSWIGSIQNLEKDSELNLLGFKSCMTDSLSFDMVFNIIEKSKINSLSELFDKGESNNYKDFNIYLFLIPMKNKEEFESSNPHGDPNIYPSIVYIFKRVEISKWLFLKSEKVNSLKEYSLLQKSALDL